MTVRSTDLGLYRSDYLPKPYKNWRYVIPSLGMLLLLLLGTILVAASAKKSTIHKLENFMQSEKIEWPMESKRAAHDIPAPFKHKCVLAAERPPESFKIMNKPSAFTKRENRNRQNSDHFPKSIQDIIQGLASTNLPNREEFKKRQSQPDFTDHSLIGNGFHMEDPFYNFKPNTPGEVNLLATASVRFAQPVWQTFSSVGVHKPSFGQKLYQYANKSSHKQKTKGEYEGETKPLAITLNIFGEHPLKKFASRLLPVNREYHGRRSKDGRIHESENVTINLKVVPEIRHHGTPVK